MSSVQNLHLYLLAFLTSTFLGCAQLHHVQIGEVTDKSGFTSQKFEVLLSETGINIEEASKVAKIFLNRKGDEAAEKVAGVVGLFQMGPRTGNPVYVKDYARDLIKVIYEKCPSGNVTGLTSIRETRKYPVVSGEIVKVTGYCLVKKT